MKAVIAWHMVGHSYTRNGFKRSGFTQVIFSDGTSRYWPEDVAIGPALDECDKQGIDTTETRQCIADPSAWKFSLR